MSLSMRQKVEEPLYLRYDSPDLVVYTRNSCVFPERVNLHAQLRSELSCRRFVACGPTEEHTSLWWDDQARTTLRFTNLIGDRPADLDALVTQRALHALRTGFKCRYLAEGTASIHTQQDRQGSPVSHTVTIKHCGHPEMAAGQAQPWVMEDRKYTIKDDVLSFMVPGETQMSTLRRQTIRGAKTLGLFLPEAPTLTHSCQ